MKYDDCFLKSRRVASLKPIALVKGDMFPVFIQRLVDDSSVDEEYKAFLICSVSGGLRVEEALALTKNSFETIDNQLFFQSNVLKKRREDSRWSRVHPSGQATVARVLRDKIGPLFDWTQGTALVRAKKLFNVEGICNHSFRHSAVSYFLFEENLSIAKTAKLIHINNQVVDVYAHLDERQVLKTLFKK